MLLRIILIITFHFFWTTLALECLNCNQILNLKSSETINTDRPECSLVDVQYESCSQLLHIQYQSDSASVVFEPTPHESLVLFNAGQIMMNTTMIWLNKIQFNRIFQIFCFHTGACKADVIKNIYIQG